MLVGSLLEAGGHSHSNRMMRIPSEDHSNVTRICRDRNRSPLQTSASECPSCVGVRLGMEVRGKRKRISLREDSATLSIGRQVLVRD